MRYLIYCGPGIGDFIITLPMAAAIKEKDPNGYIRMITTSDHNRIQLSKKLARFQRFVDDIDYYSHKEKIQSLKMLLRNGYKRFNYGFVIQYTANSNTSSMPSKIVRLASKITCGMKVPMRKDIKYNFYINYVPGTKITSYPLLLLETIGIEIKKQSESLLDQKKISRYLPPLTIDKNARIITLCVGTAKVSYKVNGIIRENNSKNWPYEYWVKLANCLTQQDYTVILLGGKKEKEEFEPYCNKLSSNRIINCLGVFTIEQSLSILQISNIVVGADTGMMHCSGALLKLNLTIFGCTDYHEYVPMGEKSFFINTNEKCSPCFGTELSVLCNSHKCMYNITPDIVIKKINYILEDNDK